MPVIPISRMSRGFSVTLYNMIQGTFLPAQQLLLGCKIYNKLKRHNSNKMCLIKTAFTRCRNNLQTVRNLIVRNSLQDFDAIERYLHPKCRSVLFQKRRKMFQLHHFQMFTRCCFQNVPVRVQFSKPTVFKMCRQKMCRFLVNGWPIRRICHRFKLCRHRVNAV